MRFFKFIDYNMERLVRNWRQKRAHEWAEECGFGMDLTERARRVLEARCCGREAGGEC